MATLKTTTGYEYTPTHEDMLWLGRALDGEGRPYNAVAHALVSRYLWLQEKGYRGPESLGRYVQAYAQPVNPRWQEGGDKHASFLAQGGSAKKARARHLRIEEQRGLQWDELRSEALAALDYVLQHDGPVRFTDYHRDSGIDGPWSEVLNATPGQNAMYRLNAIPSGWGWLSIAKRPLPSPPYLAYVPSGAAAVDSPGSEANPPGWAGLPPDIVPVLLAVGVALVALRKWLK